MRRFLIAIIAASALFTTTRADALSFTVKKVATLSQPIGFAVRAAEPNAAYIAQKSGVIRRITYTNGAATVTAGNVLDLRDRLTTQGERGIAGLTFSPNGSKLYVAYATTGGAARLAEYPFANGKANKTKERVLKQFTHTGEHHYGGGLAFGADGFLYWSTGDGGMGTNAQNLNSFLGKMLRVKPAAPVTVEVWHRGLRNPYRWSFDKATGDMWIADVGQDRFEEVNRVPGTMKGANFGWPNREGFEPYNGGAKPPGNVDPVFAISHDTGSCAVIGGYVFKGTYVYTDNCDGTIRGLVGSTSSPLGASVVRPSSFGLDNQNNLWVLSISGGIFQLRD